MMALVQSLTMLGIVMVLIFVIRFIDKTIMPKLNELENNVNIIELDNLKKEITIIKRDYLGIE